MKLRKRTLRFVSDPNTSDPTDGKKRKISVLRRSASEVMNYRLARKIVLIGVAIGIAILLIAYAFVLLYNRTGRFSVAVDNPDATFSITLSETSDFKMRSSRLTNDQQVRITNICGDSLPKNINNIDGQHNGENYLAYTFYCKNVGAVATAMHYEMTFNNVTNHIDECMRVRIYVTKENEEERFTDYAKTRSDGQGKEGHYCDKSFRGKYLVCREAVEYVVPQEYVKFTVVIWVEGDDPDCTDAVVNGMIKFDMSIEAKPAVETESNG